MTYALWLGALWLGQSTMVYPGTRLSRAPASDLALDRVHTLRVPIPDGHAEAWLLLGEGATAEAPGPLVVYTHGNFELVEHAIWRALPYTELGVSVLLPEYRGFGGLPGEPSEAAIVDDFSRLVQRAVARPEVDGERVVHHGRSLGGGPAAQLALVRRPKALVLESTFRSLEPFAASMGAPAALLRDTWHVEAPVRDLGLPTLVLHGEADEVVPHTHGEALAAAHPSATLATFPDGHNDLPQDRTRYWRLVRDHLVASGVLPAPGGPLDARAEVR